MDHIEAVVRELLPHANYVLGLRQHLVVGEFCSERRFTEGFKEITQTRIVEAEMDVGPPGETADRLRSLLFTNPDTEPDDRYITLRSASIVSLGDHAVELPSFRLDTESISAWWLGPWSVPSDDPKVARGSQVS